MRKRSTKSENKKNTIKKYFSSLTGWFSGIKDHQRVRRKRRSIVEVDRKKNIFKNSFTIKASFLFIAIFFVVLLIFLIRTFISIYTIDVKGIIRDEQIEDWKGERMLNILLIGLDKKEAPYAFADYLSIVSIDSESSTWKIFTMNVDVNTYLRSKGNYYKLRNLYNLGVFEDDRERYLKEGVESLTAINIDRYILADREGAQNIMNSIGGAYVFNPSKFEDKELAFDSSGKVFGLDKGNFSLNGEDLMSFARSDSIDNDTKLTRQNNCLSGIGARISSPRITLSLDKIISSIEDNIVTDMSNNEIRRLGFTFVKLRKVNTGFLKESSLYREENGLDYPVWSKIDKDIREVFSVQNIEKEQARVEIFNATMENGFATRKARELENLGFDIIRVGNTSLPEPENIIYTLDPKKYTHSITLIKNIVGGSTKVVKEMPSFVSTGDIVIILGKSDQ